MWTPAPLEDDWRATLAEVARARGLAFGDARAVRALSDAYNDLAPRSDRRALTSAAALGARLSFFFPRDVPKCGGATRELAAMGLLGRRERALSVLDLGAGLGASAWGVARAHAAFGGGAVRATLVDDDGAALDVAGAIARARRGPLEVECAPRDVRRFTTESRFDVVVLGQVLAELGATPEEDADRLAALLDRNVRDDGTLVVVEPALRARARHLQRVRDRVLARGVTVFAPCTRRGACPMLVHEKDWCHEDLDVDLPSWLAPVARAAGLRWEGLTFAYLALRKDGRALAERSGALRVVSRPLVTKGKRELDLCGEGGLVRAVRLDRDRAPDNAAWDEAGRGAILSIAPALDPSSGSPRVARDARVTTVEVDDRPGRS